MLIDLLGIDPGYLSRILKRLEKLGLTYRVHSDEDGRSSLLFLTKQGEETLDPMNALSDDQIRNMIQDLPDHMQASIASSMATIEKALNNNPSVQNVSIRTELMPGDVGMLIHMHGWIYAKECGYNHGFEAYVCKTFYELLQTYNPVKDRFWIAEIDGQMAGNIAIIGHPNGKAQLRWFILHPDYRGMGLGKRLLQEAIRYCEERGFRHVYLETTEDQQTAIAMYMKAGFQKVAEHENDAWGIRHVELTYELDLAKRTLGM